MKSLIAILAVIFIGSAGVEARAQEAGVTPDVNAVNGASPRPRPTPTLVIINEVARPAPEPAPPAPGDKAAKPAPGKGATVAIPQVNVTPPPIKVAGANTGLSSTGNPAYDALVLKSAQRYGVDPNLIFAVMHQESGGNPRAVSYKGASGLMQLMPATAQRFGVTNIFDPAQNIDAGVRYLRWLLDTFNNDVELALAGYNAGEGAVIKYGYQVPRYRETQHYVKVITARYGKTRNKAAQAAKPAAPPQVIVPTTVTFSNGRFSNNY